jgi:hypothetical protein
MIGHETISGNSYFWRAATIRVDFPAGLGAGLTEGGEESLPAEVIVEDRFAPVSATRDVIGDNWRQDIGSAVDGAWLRFTAACR